jgi:molybdopterin-guanine dinucleotide biosynthesis protein A
MGFPKAFMPVGKKRSIECILEVFRDLFEEIVIVTNASEHFREFGDIRIESDHVDGCGPLGGIYTGLRVISKEKAFFAACDMPFLERDLITRLLEVSREDDRECVIPVSHRGIEPLHGVYSRSVLPALEEALRQNDLSVRALLSRCACRYVEVTQRDATSFTNINTPGDLNKVRR